METLSCPHFVDNSGHYYYNRSEKEKQMKQVKTSIRFFNKVAVRARWDEETLSWWYSATDIIQTLTHSKNARRYWNTFKSRHPELSSLCRQLKMTSSDGKQYVTDCLDQTGINRLMLILPTKYQPEFMDWLKGLSDPIDEQSKRKAYELHENSILDSTEAGTIRGLQQIHAFLFEGLYDFAGKIRTKNISKGGFAFANCRFFPKIFHNIESMPDETAEEIILKYVEMNIAHPFMEGNGRATRIWLDHLFKTRIGKCVDWQKINKQDYLHAMEKSPVDPTEINNLLRGALTDEITDREIFMKGIDYSYYYESMDD